MREQGANIRAATNRGIRLRGHHFDRSNFVSSVTARTNPLVLDSAAISVIVVRPESEESRYDRARSKTCPGDRSVGISRRSPLRGAAAPGRTRPCAGPLQLQL